jgi:hypothetical protein
MTEPERILALIASYTDFAERACARLRAAFGVNDLLSAVVEKRIPRAGTAAGIEFRFHGVGCEFRIDGTCIDVDFGPEGRCDGFDAWRLSLFASSEPQWSDLATESAVQHGLDLLTESGAITRPEWQPSPHLYYRTAVKSSQQGHRLS